MADTCVDPRALELLSTSLARLKAPGADLYDRRVWGAGTLATPGPPQLCDYDPYSNARLQSANSLENLKTTLRDLTAIRDLVYDLSYAVREVLTDTQTKFIPLILEDGIRRLPDELLAQIFLETWDEYLPLLTAVRLSHVCRRFRAIALGLSQLWADADTRVPLDEMAEMLNRSAQAPLNVAIHSNLEEEDLKEFLDMVIPHHQRWRSLYIAHVPDSLANVRVALATRGELDLPQLVHIAPYATADHFLDIGRSFSYLSAWNMPKLRSVDESYASLSWPDLQNITECRSIYPLHWFPIHKLLGYLRRMRRLRTLDMVFECLPDYPAAHNDLSKCWKEDDRMQSLQSFSIDMNKLSLPQAHSTVFNMLSVLRISQLVSFRFVANHPESPSLIEQFLKQDAWNSLEELNLKIDYRNATLYLSRSLFARCVKLMPKLKRIVFSGQAPALNACVVSSFSGADYFWNHFLRLDTMVFRHCQVDPELIEGIASSWGGAQDVWKGEKTLEVYGCPHMDEFFFHRVGRMTKPGVRLNWLLRTSNHLTDDWEERLAD